jgi:hypothetical protein
MQDDYLLITLTIQRDLDRRLYSADPAATRRFTDPAAAVDATASFLRSFVPSTDPRHAGEDTR